MEEKVGELWHRIITQAASNRYPNAAMTLEGVTRTVGIVFRALGGDGGLEIHSTTETDHGARRTLLQRIAGSNQKVALAWRDHRSLYLPAAIDCFPTTHLNRDLYIWLAALAVGESAAEEPWFSLNQRLTLDTLKRFPGIRLRYRRLVEAHLSQRAKALRRAIGDEAVQERTILQALVNPGSVAQLPAASRPPFPVPLWLHPSPPAAESSSTGEPDPAGTNRGETKALDDRRKRTAERAKKTPTQDKGLITIRMENIFNFGEFLNLDRGSEENDDLDSAADAARDMEKMSISRDAKASAGKLKFDLDLPSEANDDLILNEGILLPEWDFKRQKYQQDHCRLVPMIAVDAKARLLPEHLRKTARKLRAQFQYLAPVRVWHRSQQEGCEIDIDAYLRFATDRLVGHEVSPDGLYKDLRIGGRDLVSLLLADLSLSTDTWVNNHSRVIDVIRDSLFLFAESLSATGDQFAMFGFSSRKRDPIRFHLLKRFEEPYSETVRGRIDAIKPGYYTRMGAAIRHSSALLRKQPAGQRLLLMLTDGKPNDLDKYEGRYGIEDTRKAILEARQEGIQPFCVTIDARGNDYLPHIFGTGSYVVIHNPSQLPRELPLLYAKLTK